MTREHSVMFMPKRRTCETPKFLQVGMLVGAHQSLNTVNTASLVSTWDGSAPTSIPDFGNAGSTQVVSGLDGQEPAQ